MKTILKIVLSLLVTTFLASCAKEKESASGSNVIVHFNNTFKNTTIVLGNPSDPRLTTSAAPTKNVSVNKQEHFFAELKYVISNVRLVTVDGKEVAYFLDDLDLGAWVINQAKPGTLDVVMKNIPSGEYKEIRFGLGVKQGLNTLDEVRVPKFYAAAGANDTKMMWEWGTGYRFTKIEGFYGDNNEPLSIHTGSTLDGELNDPSSYVPGVDAYREIRLVLPTIANVGKSEPKITIKADFDKLLSGKTNTITLGKGNALPSVHTADNMVLFVDNLGGNGTSDVTGMFSVQSVEN